MSDLMSSGASLAEHVLATRLLVTRLSVRDPERASVLLGELDSACFSHDQDGDDARLRAELERVEEGATFR
ncbi:MAG: hypothetical protein ABWZ77_03310 [Naasia sp.]